MRGGKILDEFQPVAAGHGEIGDDEIRLERFHLGERLLHVARHAADAESGLGADHPGQPSSRSG